MYDNNGDIFGLTCNGESYYYIKNAQNDVVAIADSNKTIVAKYFYSGYGGVSEITDADGKDISYKAEHIANINPILYRSYYYDAETNFYYLNSRYYSADICRFLNADAYASTNQGLLGSNMFVYCLNNPVNFYDPSGSYAVVFPAEGNGELIIIPDKGDPELTVSHQGDTYTVEVHPGTGGNSPTAGVINAVNGTLLTEIAEESIKRLGDLQYQNYVVISFSNASGAILKNIGRAGNNAIYTALSPCLNDMKTLSKGIVTMAAFAVDCFMDYCTYGGNSTDFAIAVSIDIAFVCLGVLAGAMLAGASPVVFVIGTVVSGTVLAYCQDSFKKNIIGY